MKFFDWRYAGKAIVSGIVVAISSILLLISGNETLADVTFVEWLVVALAVLGAYGFTYQAPANQSTKRGGVV